jgi:DNA adenine methylase
MIKPLFMWAGGKRKMLKHHAPYLPKQCNVYSEPFFGGGAMFLHVQKVFSPKKSFINDSNEGIINIYRQVKTNPKDFCAIMDEYQAAYLLLDKADRKCYYYDIRQQHAFEFKEWESVKEAATLYFLMKTGFNGVWQINKNTNGRYGTPSGLLNQDKSVYDREIVMAWNKLLQNTEVYCGDFSMCPSGDLNYFDPPYRNSYTNYGTDWNDEATEMLLDYAKGLNGWTLICNRCDGSDYYKQYEKDFQIVRFPVTYTAGRRKKVETGFEAKKATEVLLWKTQQTKPS